MNRYMVKAKALMNKEWVTGYYYKMSETTYCPIGEIPPVPVHHYVLVESMTDWGLPNRMIRYEEWSKPEEGIYKGLTVVVDYDL